MSPKNQKAILITGASTGIGRATALRLAADGHTVFAGVRNHADADSLRTENNTLQPILLDITQPDHITAARQFIGDHLNSQPLHGIVNNAGVVVSGPMECIAIDDLRRQFEINVFGHIAVTQVFLDLLRQSHGRIVNISSIAGRSTLPFVGPYSASKFALNVFSEAFRMELAPWGIHVALIEPGSIVTPIWDKSIQAAEEKTGTYPPDKLALYEKALSKVRDASRNSVARGLHTDHVVTAIRHALFSNTPQTRYLIGNDAVQRAWFSKLPDTLKEKLILKKLGLTP